MTISVSAFSAWAWKKFENYDLEKSYQSQGAIGRVWDYYKILKDLLDGNKKTGGYLKLGVKLSLDAVGKAIGYNLTAHPYFAYHKAHLQALADALNAQANSKKAIEEFNKAVAAADSTKDIAAILGEYQKRTQVFGFQYASFAGALGLLDDLNNGGAARSAAQRTMRDYGVTMDELRSAEDNLKAWRENWVGLYMESLQVLTMTEVEYGNADEAMAQFKKILADMMKGSNMSKVAGYATQQDIYWEQYDRMTHPSQQKPEQAVLDPTNYAKSKRDDVNSVTRALAEICTFVLSRDVRDKDKADRAGAALGRVFASV